MLGLLFFGYNTQQLLFDKDLRVKISERSVLWNICYGTALTTILPILFLYLNTVTVTAGTFEP